MKSVNEIFKKGLYTGRGPSHCLTSEFKDLMRLRQFKKDIKTHRRILNRLVRKVQDVTLPEHQRDQANRKLDQLYPNFSIHATAFFAHMARANVEYKERMREYSILIN